MADHQFDQPQKEATQIIDSINDLPEPVLTKFEPFRPSNSQVFMLSVGGVLFLIASLGALSALVWKLISTPEVPISELLKRADAPPEAINKLMTDFYLSVYLSPLILLIAAILAALIGYGLLRAAGTATQEAIPQKDYELLSHLILMKNTEGIDNYIRLSSLSGLVGTFTKIGLSGLPLATIGLTFIFTLLSVFGAQFFDLARLTLGAFIGSYVQRTATERSAAPLVAPEVSPTAARLRR